VQATGRLNLTGSFSNFNGATLTGGTYQVMGTFQFANAAINTNAATIVLNGTAARIVNQTGANALSNFTLNAAAGSFTFQNGPTFHYPRNFTNAGTLVFGPGSAGTLTGTLSNSGGLTVAAGSTLTLSNSYTQSGSLHILATGTLRLLGGGSSTSLITNDGTLVIGSTVTVNGSYNQTGTLNVQANGSLNLLGGGSSSGSISDDGTLVIGSGTTFTDSGSYSETGALSVEATGRLNLTGSFSNFSGTTLTGGTYQVMGTFQFANAAINTNAATIVLDGTGARIVNQAGGNAFANFTLNAASGSFTFRNGPTFRYPRSFTNEGTVVFGPGSRATITGSLQNEGALTIGDGGNLTFGPITNSGAINLGAGTTLASTGDYTQSAGTIVLAGSTLTSGGTVNLQAGVLSGTGSLNGAVVNAAEIDVGTSTVAGTLTVNGDYSQPGGTLVMKIGGRNVGEFDQLDISGQAVFAGGTLSIRLINGFMPDPTIPDTFQIVTFGTHDPMDDFATYLGTDLGNGVVLAPQYTATTLSLVATQTPAPALAAGGPSAESGLSQAMAVDSFFQTLGSGAMEHQWPDLVTAV
jgi:hypothetical protein